MIIIISKFNDRGIQMFYNIESVLFKLTKLTCIYSKGPQSATITYKVSEHDINYLFPIVFASYILIQVLLIRI